MVSPNNFSLKEVLDARPSDLIIPGITNSELDKRLEHQLKEKSIRPEQWFREPTNWYEISSYINPYRAITDEIGILFHHEKELSRIINKTLKVFWGVGIADSEIFPVIWDLKSNAYVEINAIDVIQYFLHGFILCLKNLRKRDYPDGRIMFVGNNTLFETTKKDRIKPPNAVYRTATHVCFGNSIGNFDQNEIFEIFKRNSEKGDYLLVGYHLFRDPRKILNLYEGNPRYERFVTEPLSRAGGFRAFSRIWRRLKGIEIEWKYNPKTDFVEARLGNILVFRSKKYVPEKLQKHARKFGFSHVETYTQGDSAISLFKVVKS